MPVIELRNGSAIEERQPMKFNERIRDVIVLPSKPETCMVGRCGRFKRSPAHGRKPTVNHRHDDTNHLPSVVLMPSQTAPRKPVTMMVMTALKV
jgi:hypothetical protein